MGFKTKNFDPNSHNYNNSNIGSRNYDNSNIRSRCPSNPCTGDYDNIFEKSGYEVKKRRKDLIACKNYQKIADKFLKYIEDQKCINDKSNSKAFFIAEVGHESKPYNEIESAKQFTKKQRGVMKRNINEEKRKMNRNLQLFTNKIYIIFLSKIV